MVYIDESENSSTEHEWTPRVFGLTGLVITARYVASFVDTFSRLKEDSDVPQEKEVKGYDIFGERDWAGLDVPGRARFCEELSKAIVAKNSLAKGFFVFKDSELQKDDYLACLRQIIDHSKDFVRRHGGRTGKQLLVVFDEKREFQGRINQLILESGSNSSSGRGACRVIDQGFPGKSNLSPMLQMADFCGYVMRLSKTLQRESDLFSKGKDRRLIGLVDSLVRILHKKIQEVSL